jgi:hypothetical protein
MGTLFEILAREQSLGEGHARLLHDRGRGDPETYAAGLLAYMEAKAAFDALIEVAKNHLIEGRELNEVDGFRAKVTAAVQRRAAFTELVRTRVLDFEVGTRGGLEDLLNPAEWAKSLVDSVLAVLKSFREADETRRKETLAQLDGLKWRPFEVLTRP